MATSIKINKSQLINDLKCGLKRADIATKYGISKNQVKKLMELAGLKQSRAAHVEFDFTDDTIKPDAGPETADLAPETASQE